MNYNAVIRTTVAPSRDRPFGCQATTFVQDGSESDPSFAPMSTDVGQVGREGRRIGEKGAVDDV
jgi:hypothetical protein